MFGELCAGGSEVCRGKDRWQSEGQGQVAIRYHEPGQAENWYFVLPNLSISGSRGVIIKLRHGVVISWDGRKIYHCSSMATPGQGNKVFGCMWGSAKN